MTRHRLPVPAGLEQTWVGCQLLIKQSVVVVMGEWVGERVGEWVGGALLGQRDLEEADLEEEMESAAERRQAWRLEGQTVVADCQCWFYKMRFLLIPDSSGAVWDRKSFYCCLSCRSSPNPNKRWTAPGTAVQTKLQGSFRPTRVRLAQENRSLIIRRRSGSRELRTNFTAINAFTF